MAETRHPADTPRPHVEITVIEVKGSAPREPGARMLWFPDGSIEGTIGGGNLEHQATEEARALWTAPDASTRVLEYPLSASLGQCCGGMVRVFLARRLPAREVLICGAGHVSTALAEVLAGTPLRVTVVDPREEWAAAARFPSGVRVLADDIEAVVAEQAARAENTYLLIMTHQHPVDEALCRLALRHPFAWIGLIGSRTKWRRFRQRLSARGFGEAELARIICPIGDPALGRTPREIAIGVADQLLGLLHGVAGAGEARVIEHAAGVRAALILAGGRSSRMGRWKGGLEFEGRALVALHGERFGEAGADLWKAVYPAAIREEAEAAVGPAHRIRNDDPDAPMFASLQLGLRALIRERPDLDSVLVTPVDLPPVDADLIAALWDRHETSGAWVTRPVARDPADGAVRRGHPVILDQRLFAPILAADPAEARLDFLVRDLPDALKAAFELPDSAALGNLNTPEDYERALG